MISAFFFLMKQACRLLLLLAAATIEYTAVTLMLKTPAISSPVRVLEAASLAT